MIVARTIWIIVTAALSTPMLVMAQGQTAFQQFSQNNVEFQRTSQSANAGISIAQAKLAIAYQYGTVVDADPQTAVSWLSKAIANGSVEAKAHLGTMYLTGQGVKRNVPQGLQMLKEAAAAGDPTGMTEFGATYVFGLGTDKDFATARSLFEQAAKLGDAHATEWLSLMYRWGDGGPTDVATADKLEQEAAAGGDAKAQSRLGDLYFGVKKDIPTAFSYYSAAALGGDTRAQARLAWMYENGIGTPQNVDLALVLAHRAAFKNNAFGMTELGRMLAYGNGVPKDLAAAFVWLRVAQEANYLPAFELVKKIQPELTTADLTRSNYLFEHLHEFYQEQKTLPSHP